jgi:hypothetical protein
MALWSLPVLGEQTLEKVERVSHHGYSIPPDYMNWQPTTLPDPWIGRLPSRRAFAWYRVPFKLEGESKYGHVVFMPRVVGESIDLYLNEQLLYRSTDHAKPDSLIVPLVARIPAELLRDGENILHARMVGHPGYWQGMPRITIGTSHELEARMRNWRLLQYEIVPIFGFALSLVGVLALAFWAVDRSDPVLVWHRGRGDRVGGGVVRKHADWKLPRLDACPYFPLVPRCSHANGDCASATRGLEAALA